MPLYEYVCRNCSRQFEELVFGRATPACPGCGTSEVEKMMSVVSVGRREADAAPAGCGTCGDPRGPGACRSN